MLHIWVDVGGRGRCVTYLGRWWGVGEGVHYIFGVDVGPGGGVLHLWVDVGEGRCDILYVHMLPFVCMSVCLCFSVATVSIFVLCLVMFQRHPQCCG